MCTAPNTLANGQATACHKCWQCREQTINDWVGRNIAETKTAVAANVITLTYGRGRAGDVDHERAFVLTYSDIQKYLKLLRRHGFPVRYFAVGEYGSLKGRAHWHIIVYWQGDVPPHKLNQNFLEEHWPHGWSYWSGSDTAAVRYTCKYLYKDVNADGHRQGHLAMSKKPPLGAKYFKQLAERYVEQGLAPQSLEYSFPEAVRRQTGEVIQFVLKDRPAEMFLEHYLARWTEVHPGRGVPKSQLIEEFLDPDAKKRRVIMERFAELPPDLNAHQRLQVDRDRAALEELDKPEGNLPVRRTDWAPDREYGPTGCERIWELNRVLYNQQHERRYGVRQNMMERELGEER